MAACRFRAVLVALGVLRVCAASSGPGAQSEAGGEAEWEEPWDGAVFRPPSPLGAVGMARSSGGSQPAEVAADLPVLLWWSPGLFPHFPGDSERIECTRGACVASRDRRVRGDVRTRALLFYGTDFRASEAPLPRLAHQSWALLHEESPLNNFLLSHGPGIRLFNLTATFSRHSDYPLPLQWLPGTAYLRRAALPLQERNEWRRRGYAPLLYLQSHCDVPADRDRYVRELMRYIPVGGWVGQGAGSGPREGRAGLRQDLGGTGHSFLTGSPLPRLRWTRTENACRIGSCPPPGYRTQPQPPPRIQTCWPFCPAISSTWLSKTPSAMTT